MKDKLTFSLSDFIGIIGGDEDEYSSYDDVDVVFHDNAVNECILRMYFVMLTDENDEKYDERFKKFEEIYDSLDYDEQQEVKDELLEIQSLREERRDDHKSKNKSKRKNINFRL